MPLKPEVKQVLNRTLEALLPLVAVPLAMIIGAAVLLAMNINPLAAFNALLKGAAGDVSGITQTLVKATPLLLVGLGVVIAFRGGVINIGAEGQIIVGALATTALSVGFPDLPRWLLLPAALLTGTLAGAIWGRHSRYPQSPAGRQRNPQHSDDECYCRATF